MNGIAGIDSSSAWLMRDNANASPNRDFADELAKDVPRATTHAPPAAEHPHDAKPAVTLGERSDVENPEGRPSDPLQAILPANGLPEPPIEPQQAAQPVVPVGVTEAFIGARVFGLHLAAQGYLSVLSAAQLSEESHAQDMSLTDVDAAAAHRADAAVSTFTQPMNAQESVSEPIFASLGMQAEALAGSELGGAYISATSEALAGAPASALVWPERVVRTVRDPNHGLSIWLRDYRATADETSRLVGQLAEQARMQGVQLNRIILNGREVWTSRGGTNQGDAYVG